MVKGELSKLGIVGNVLSEGEFPGKACPQKIVLGELSGYG